MRAAPFLLLLASLLSLALAQEPPPLLPPYPPTWDMASSTAVMMCNYSGYQTADSTQKWGIVDVDWSNSLADWSAATPMDTNERLMVQAAATTAAQPNTRVWIYRNSVYGYPWYNTVRFILDDPTYSPWFIKFKPQPPYYSPQCDDNYQPPKCTNFFHTQMDTPRPGPGGYGVCAPPACNCGSKPCGFYVFNHSSDVVVHGQTFQEWFINSYIMDSIGSSPLVSGFFFDDFWSPSGNMGDNTKNATEDMGLTPADLLQLTASYLTNMAAVRTRLLDVGKFAWQYLWTGGAADAKGETCPSPLVRNVTCAANLRELCQASSPQYTQRAMLYSFSPGACSHDVEPNVLADLEQDLASFLLTRGPFAWIGHGWLGCSRQYSHPPALSADYGEPTGLCAETAPGSSIFVRDYSKATVQMDCNAWKGSITMK